VFGRHTLLEYPINTLTEHDCLADPPGAHQNYRPVDRTISDQLTKWQEICSFRHSRDGNIDPAGFAPPRIVKGHPFADFSIRYVQHYSQNRIKIVILHKAHLCRSIDTPDCPVMMATLERHLAHHASLTWR
jgi:hypothetical protein